jgi:hypothetical protein
MDARGEVLSRRGPLVENRFACRVPMRPSSPRSRPAQVAGIARPWPSWRRPRSGLILRSGDGRRVPPTARSTRPCPRGRRAGHRGHLRCENTGLRTGLAARRARQRICGRVSGPGVSVWRPDNQRRVVDRFDDRRVPGRPAAVAADEPDVSLRAFRVASVVRHALDGRTSVSLL